MSGSGRGRRFGRVIANEGAKACRRSGLSGRLQQLRPPRTQPGAARHIGHQFRRHAAERSRPVLADLHQPWRDRAGLVDTGLHNLWHPKNAGFKELRSGLNLYHLKMIDPARRSARRDLLLDPHRRDQAIGCDYLADETGVRLETIPADRSYHPPHLDDGGLWMFDVQGKGGVEV
ncbi:hypothetical protein [Aminobacter sp. MDW-2]|uniref:hypothetical protein n=1 Tax=Aminobacter sp. MDW-2 TaxID=2666139 RepID=UPI00163BF2E0|nr:hypothetical protein [Aminobacter sp. MDW-2]QNH33267.1 hypothetical protein H5P29_22555 [Aminobacter sp. MDW-2]